VVDGRKHPARMLAALCVTALGSSVLVAAPSVAKPDIPTVQSRVDKLYQQAEQASERYNDARLRLKKAQKSLGAVRTDLRRQRTQVSTVRSRVAASVVAQYQGQTLTSTSRVLLADSPDTFLDQLNTVAQYDDQQAQLMADYAARADRLAERRTQAQRELDDIAETKTQLGTEKAQIDRKAAAAKKLLAELKDRAAERASRSANRTATSAPAPSHVAASGRAAAAVRYALAQVGDAYVYGAAGPSAFDCSGLTMMAWAQAGVSLPHSSSAQTGSGTPVSQSELQPGDLVFYYSPVSHVGMYIGNGLIVNAENPSVGVKITGVNSMPYSGAVRPG
jgi:cell wall-associated NlpC family hydrolase